jgi:SAM-dependent methyltransferase
MTRQCGIDRRPGPIGRAVSAQAARPHGLLGWALGRLWVHETAALNDKAIALLDPAPGEAVLDLGCGPGRAVAAIAERGARVTGIDPSPVMISQARHRNRAAVASGQVQLHTGDAESLPAPYATIDAALTVHTLYFWPDLLAGLREIHRVLVPGGRLAIGLRPAERGLQRRLDPVVYRGPTTDRLLDALHSTGFEDTTVHEALPAVIVLARKPA